jgi:Ca2+/Na+ antiporter
MQNESDDSLSYISNDDKQSDSAASYKDDKMTLSGISTKYDENNENIESESKLMHVLEMMCWPALKILNKLLPVETWPIFSFLAIVVMFFVSMDFLLTVISVLSVYTHLSQILIGLTIISWGSSPIEFINLIISAKKNEMQIGLTSILSGIVFTFLVLMPIAMIFKMIKRGSHEIEIL